MSKIIFISNNKRLAKAVKVFAVEKKHDYDHYTEEEWATFEDIEYYINGDDPLGIPNLPVGCYPVSTMESMKVFTIKKAMANAQGNVLQAAKTLGLSRSTLYRKLDKYKIDVSDIRDENEKPKDNILSIEKVRKFFEEKSKGNKKFKKAS